jgi:hypothetical protein
MSLYQISSDYPQKDNFHNTIFNIDKFVTFGIVSSTFLTWPSQNQTGNLRIEKDEIFQNALGCL